MRFAVRIDPNHVLPCAALLAALALIALPGGVHGQETGQAGTATLADPAGSVDHPCFTFTSAQSAAPASDDIGAGTLSERSQLTGYTLSLRSDAASLNDISLDDQMLARQRGGALGKVMVAATPQLLSSNSNVTLWDEIAPPSPMPIPVDAARNAQGNVAMYQRK